MAAEFAGIALPDLEITSIDAEPSTDQTGLTPTQEADRIMVAVRNRGATPALGVSVMARTFGVAGSNSLGAANLPLIGTGATVTTVFDAVLSTGTVSLVAEVDRENVLIEKDKANNLMIKALTVPLDRNGNGLPDLWENRYFGGWTNAVPYADSDTDGVCNITEYLADTDPTNPVSRLELANLLWTDGVIVISWKGGQWARQYVEVKTDLCNTSEQWSVIFTNLPPTTITTNIVEAGATNRSLFYRIRAER